MSERWEIDVMRTVAAVFALLAAVGCSSSNQLSQHAAHIPQPEITIIGRTDLVNIPSIASGVPAHFEFRIVNQAEVPITLRSIDLTSLGGGSIGIQSRNRKFDTVIAPHMAQSVDFLTTAYLNDPNSFRGRSPVQIRAVALFDSTEGSLQKVVQQQVRPEGAD
jgi:predicted component of type VI protein secretion system